MIAWLKGRVMCTPHGHNLPRTLRLLSTDEYGLFFAFERVSTFNVQRTKLVDLITLTLLFMTCTIVTYTRLIH